MFHPPIDKQIGPNLYAFQCNGVEIVAMDMIEPQKAYNEIGIVVKNEERFPVMEEILCAAEQFWDESDPVYVILNRKAMTPTKSVLLYCPYFA